MDYIFEKDGPEEPEENENLRKAVGWDRSEGVYTQILQRQYAYYTARSENHELIGYVSVKSDGVADAFLLDLMVHPDYQGKELGIHLVKTVIRDMRQADIRCIQVTFDDQL